MRIAEKNEWISNHYQSILFGFKYKLLDDVVTIENISRICFSKCFSVFWPHAFEYHKHRKVPDLADEVEWPKFVKCPSVSGDQKVPGLIFFKYVEKYYRLFNLIRSKYPPPLSCHTLLATALLLLETCRKCIFLNSVHLKWFLCSPQLCPPWRGTWVFGIKKEVDMDQIRRVRGVEEELPYHSFYKNRDWFDKCQIRGRIVVVQHPFTTAPNLVSLPSSNRLKTSR